jgi:hypothetical protein
MSLKFTAGNNPSDHRGIFGTYSITLVNGCNNTNNCTANSYCQVVNGVGSCACYDGFVQSSTGMCVGRCQRSPPRPLHHKRVCVRTCISHTFSYFLHPATTCTASTCLNSGSCSNTDYGAACGCPPGYGGRNCQIDQFCGNTNPCSPVGGQCIHGTTGPVCTCYTGYTGQYCQYKLPRNSPLSCSFRFLSIFRSCSRPASRAGARRRGGVEDRRRDCPRRF